MPNLLAWLAKNQDQFVGVEFRLAEVGIARMYSPYSVRSVFGIFRDELETHLLE